MKISLQIAAIKEFLKPKVPSFPKIGLTLGSGLSSFVDQMDVDCVIPYGEIPHFVPSSVVGHPGRLIIGRLGDKPLAVLQGRVHFYEGHSLNQVTLPTRALIACGVEKIIITNAAGGLDPKMKPGCFMAISDHINLTGQNPLIGQNEDTFGPRFPDMSEPYSSTLRTQLKEISKSLRVPLFEGIYCGVTGPSYETAAEIQFMRMIGGSAVGMSTVPEVIVARHMGAEVVGLSCITNLGTGLSKNQLSHDEVKEVAGKSEDQFNQLLQKFISQISLEQIKI